MEWVISRKEQEFILTAQISSFKLKSLVNKTIDLVTKVLKPSAGIRKTLRRRVSHKAEE